MDNATSARNSTHRLFLLTILAKGGLGLLQIAVAAAIYGGLTDQIPALVQSLVATELAEDPGDFFAGRLLMMVGALPGTDRVFYTLNFAAHGMLHVIVVGALLIGATWA